MRKKLKDIKPNDTIICTSINGEFEYITINKIEGNIFYFTEDSKNYKIIISNLEDHYELGVESTEIKSGRPAKRKRDIFADIIEIFNLLKA